MTMWAHIVDFPDCQTVKLHIVGVVLKHNIAKPILTKTSYHIELTLRNPTPPFGRTNNDIKDPLTVEVVLNTVPVDNNPPVIENIMRIEAFLRTRWNDIVNRCRA